MKTIAFCLTLFFSSACLAVPVLNAPQKTGMAGYGMGDSGWIQSIMFDIEFSKPDEVNQFFKQTYFKVETKTSQSSNKKSVDSGLLSAVDDAFNNKSLLAITSVDEPPLLLLILVFSGLFLYLAITRRPKIERKETNLMGGNHD